jgi:cysteinyl-tRNA synthetase
MKLYNTLNKKVEEFIPHSDKEVTMYTCGPTVYGYAHIGNLRTFIFEDVLEKSLDFVGYNVKRVMNITDVGHLTSDSDSGEDKMVKGAKREGKTPQEIATFYTKAFFVDMSKLNINRPAIVEKATDHVKDYIKVIETLIKKDYAYISGGNVYFDVSMVPNYYELSGQNEEDFIVGARNSVDVDNNKKNQNDFVLWFTKSKFEDQDQKWESPWGLGYPGWHIECSVLASLYLGEYLDLHCGGIDLVFPHHTNEIAQSEAYFGHKWCSYWVHGEYLNDKSGKMSKSKGDVLTISLLEEIGYDALAYRYFCLGSHYRKQLEFSFDSLDIAQNAYNKLKNKIISLSDEGLVNNEMLTSYRGKFVNAINNDLNTSLMLTILYDVLKEDVNDNTKIQIIDMFDKVLGLNLLKKKEKESVLSEEIILAKIDERRIAKNNKDFALADSIRNGLLGSGIKLIDTKEETIYEIL